MAKEKKVERICRKDGKNCFVEMLDSCFPIDKVQMDFISYDVNAAAGSRQTANIPIYLDGEEFLGLVKKVENDGKAYTKYCNDHPEFKKPLFEKMGGTSAKSLKVRGKERPDGMGISRVFTISASKKGYFLTAKSGPGEEDEKGLIVPRYKDPEQRVSIAMDHDTLMELLCMGDARYRAYLTAEYVLNPISKRERGTTGGTQQKPQTQKPTTAQTQQTKPAPASKPATTQVPDYSSELEVTDADLPF